MAISLTPNKHHNDPNFGKLWLSKVVGGEYVEVRALQTVAGSMWKEFFLSQIHCFSFLTQETRLQN